MIDHKVRRLPVIDGHDLVGIVSQADLAHQRRRGEGVHVGRLGEREHDRARDVVGLQGAAGRVLEEGRVDHPGLDQRDLDVRVGDLLAQRLPIAVTACLVHE